MRKIRYFIAANFDFKSSYANYEVIRHDYAKSNDSPLSKIDIIFGQQYIVFDDIVYDLSGKNVGDVTKGIRNVINLYNLKIRNKKLSKI